MALNGWYRTFFIQHGRTYIGPWCHAVYGTNTDYGSMYTGMQNFLRKEFGKHWQGSIVVLEDKVHPYDLEMP